jgi:hypothetical protein
MAAATSACRSAVHRGRANSGLVLVLGVFGGGLEDVNRAGVSAHPTGQRQVSSLSGLDASA